MKSALVLFAILVFVSYVRCEDCEDCEETRPKTILGNYKLLKVINQTADSPDLLNYEFELMMITHKDNPNQINYSINGEMNTFNGVIYKKDNGYESNKDIITSLVASPEEEMSTEYFLKLIMASVTNVIYDEKEDQLTIESPKAKLLFEKL